jgi:hypothetical protein
VEEGDPAADKSTAAALGGWIVFEDECGQSMRPPRSRTWGRRGITPVIRVRGGGTGHVSVAGLACYRPGHRTRLIYRLHCYRGRKGETRAFTWAEYRNLLIAAHRQLRLSSPERFARWADTPRPSTPPSGRQTGWLSSPAELH